jgi:transposase
VILAEDEMSLYLQATTMRVWAPKGQTPIVRCDPGRQKTSFYGSLDLSSGHELVMQTDEMNAAVTAQYLKSILQSIPERPILLLWDRAPWHRGEPIRQVLAANSRLELMLFPVASPELNPQEQVWKDTRHAITHNHDTARLPSLADAVRQQLTTTTYPSSFLHRYGYFTLCTALN